MINFRAVARPLLTFAFICAGSSAALSAPITGLFNTGVDEDGNALAAGTADSHYEILSPSQSAIVIRDNIPGSWLNNTATRRWIWQDVNGQPTNVTRTFRTTFDLTGFSAGTAMISGQWAVDNTGLDILINGNSTGHTCSGFSALCNFSFDYGFLAGVNTIDFIVRDVGSISGFLVSSISGTADELAVGVPLPASMALLGFGLLALSRRQRAA